jgi:glutathione S-transferase
MKLLTSTTCPYAQRAVITANALKLNCEIEYIDLKNKPDWFVELTPFAKVPVMIDNENRVLFESLVVSNYLNQLHGYPLSPKDKFTNAINDAWIQHLSLCMSSLGPIARSENKEQLQEALTDFQKKLQPLEAVLGDGPYFNGEYFFMIDIFYAPLFLRMQESSQHFQVDFYQAFPKVKQWANNLLQHPVVQQSTVDNFSELYCCRFKF